MSWLGFLIFIAMTCGYIWSGKDSFSKKDWFLFVLKMAGVLIGTALFGRLMYNVISSWPVMSMDNAEKLTVSLGASFFSLLGMKFLVVVICAIFSGIMGFHKEYNAGNYNKFSSLKKAASPSLLFFVKSLVSVISVLIFYGIWFGK